MVAEGVLMPKDIGQQDSELQELINKDVERTRISTFRQSKNTERWK
ncbi:hypothetical protein HYO65_gp256 [Tenacibaculum phage PTm1]|uniref:Uncharacterized protein n=1 Tax=Tenacibaculum phage PTm1 TaxID=2547425 RepID=A0A5S9BZ89_9CAUD|nr:hypothetical protein HYO65_gp256 [Tenacibaculum phage PTm1]BBI90648.1 hypothetical protein [Tenacibaculum phage PTm1]